MPLSETAREYLDDALSYIETRSVRRGLVDWPALRATAYEQAVDADRPADTYAAIRSVLTLVGDRHSWLIPAEEGQRWGQGTGGGLGLLADAATGTVLQVHPGSPADRAGLRLGDVVLAVAGSPIPTSDEHVILPLMEREMELDVRRRDTGHTKRITLQAAEYPWHLPPRGSMVGEHVASLEIPELLYDKARILGREYVRSAHEIIRHQEGAGARGWIIDLRRNTGGDLDPMVAAIGPLVGEGVCFSFVAPSRERLPVTYRDGTVREGATSLFEISDPYRPALSNPPVAVLIGPFTMSAGEFVTLAFRNRPRTRLFGRPTFGVPTRNEMKRLKDGAVLFLTVDLGADRTGDTFDGPIAPDKAIDHDWLSFGTGDDPVVAAAMNWHRSMDGPSS